MSQNSRTRQLSAARTLANSCWLNLLSSTRRTRSSFPKSKFRASSSSLLISDDGSKSKITVLNAGVKAVM